MEHAISIELPSSPDPSLYHYYQGLKTNTFYINNEMGSDFIDEIVPPLLQADATQSPITIYLNSPGGDVYSGFTLVSILQRLKSPTKIIVLSYALSMGAFVLMAGASNPNVTRYCYPFSIGLIHGGSMALEGSLSQVKDIYKFSERYEEKIKDFVLSHTSFTEEEYNKIERSELYLTAEEMLEKGMIDEIL